MIFYASDEDDIHVKFKEFYYALHYINPNNLKVDVYYDMTYFITRKIVCMDHNIPR